MNSAGEGRELASKGHEVGWQKPLTWLAKAIELAGQGHEDRLGRDKDFLRGTQGLSSLKQVTRLCKSVLS
jgi:hypothetical protein